MKFNAEFSKFKGVFFDCDGVIWEESQLLPGALETINYLIETNLSFGFLSNNSTKSIKEYTKKFKSLGLNVEEYQVVSSVQVTINYLKNLTDRNKTLYVIGESGLSQSLKDAGFIVVEGTTNDIDAVIVGMDRNFTYKKLTIGLQACLKGARFIATNPDPQFPTPNGFFPGAGSMVGALSSALNNNAPEIICGKPNPLMAKILLERFNLKPQDVVMIGDRVSTDLECAKNAGISSVLVKTGFGSQEFRLYPDFPYYSTINSLFDLFE